jgi:hypothetical protein
LAAGFAYDKRGVASDRRRVCQADVPSGRLNRLQLVLAGHHLVLGGDLNTDTRA